MGRRFVEQEIRSASGEPEVLRIDLHGVSVSASGGSRTAVRWEWIEDITAEDDAVVVSAASGTIAIPRGTFGLLPDVLAGRLDLARSITERTDVIQQLGEGPHR